MKILVFGATGGTGSQVVQQALNQGLNVTAFVRNPEKVKISHSNLSLAQGDVLKQDDIDKIMKGHDAVVCCLGAPATKAGTLRSRGTQNIINSMQRNGVSRLICQSSLGFNDSVKVLTNTPFIFRKIIVPYLLKKTFEDHSLQETIVKRSDLNWTIIRPGSLTNGAFTGSYKHGFSYTDNSLKVKISRTDVADFLIRQLWSKEHLKEVAGVSY